MSDAQWLFCALGLATLAMLLTSAWDHRRILQAMLAPVDWGGSR